MNAAQLALGLGQAPALTRADFVVADGNRAALAAVERWPDWPGRVLVLWGPAGAGKTHLGEIWRARAGAVRLDRPVDPAAATGRAVLLDDADSDVPEAALLHLHNVAQQSGGWLLLTTGTAPAQWRIALPDLRSRLIAAPGAGIAAPDDELLSALLAKHFSDRQLRAGADLIAYLVPRMERSFAAARNLVAALDAAALAERSEIGLPLARRVLERMRNPGLL